MQDWADTTVQRLQQQLLVSLEQLHSAEDLQTQHADPSREPDRQAEDTELLRELCADDKAFEAWCLSQIDQPASQSSHAISRTSLTAPTAWQDWISDQWSADRALIESLDASRRTLVHSVLAEKAARDAIEGAIAKYDKAARQIAYDMAYGLSHELNNPLANIAARARLLAECESSDRKRQMLSSIVDQAMRGCEMISDLMNVARPPQWNIEPVDMRELCQSLNRKAQPWIEAKGLIFQSTITNRCATVHFDATAMMEALWALVRNAVEAAEHTIALQLICPEADTPQATIKERDTTLELIIEDDGPGLTSDALTRAFNSYYSAREAGRGLGMGLAKARRVAQLSGAELTIENLEPRGCRVRMCWMKRSPTSAMSVDSQ